MTEPVRELTTTPRLESRIEQIQPIEYGLAWVEQPFLVPDTDNLTPPTRVVIGLPADTSQLS